MNPTVDIVVPVHNEQAVLEASVTRLHDYLSTSVPAVADWRIIIADNASTDGTLELGRALARRHAEVSVLHLDEKGRGRALRAAWGRSAADVVCYMDVDLSTDLRALLPLVAPLLSGHSDVAIGSRLLPAAHVRRSPRRELISRAYNHILHATLRVGFTDAQCGFKAARGAVAHALLGQTKDEGWFFDTEFLVQAERRGLRIHEVAVDWIEDPDSRVDIPRTAWADLRGVARLIATWPLARFLGIGLISTAAYTLLYVLLHPSLGPQGANAAALAVTAVGNTAANRRFTFGVLGRERLLGDHAGGFVVFALTLALTAGALTVLHGVDAHPGRLLEIGVLTVATLCATATRYVALRHWVFARAREDRPALAPPAPGSVPAPDRGAA